ncbi:4Fe-4S binding protein [Puteibacter caeruleilacunae]|nr:4Fe-4S binding protein [Puteibacter caeruleilacunae]
MKQHWLKTVRQVIALFFIISASAIFLDYRELVPSSWMKLFASFQFTPSVLNSIKAATGISMFLIVLLILTVLFGRMYCSFICPLGIFQDFIIRISRKIQGKYKLRYKKPWTYIRYSIISITVLLAVFGNLLVLSLLDPYSNFGRIFSYLLQPVVVWANNGLAYILNHFNNYTLYAVKVPAIHWQVISLVLVFLIAIGWMAARRGRLFCNGICPVGTLLGIISKISIFKVAINKSQCTQCGKCVKACKSECIDIKSISIDTDRCVDCFNCIDVCPEDAMKYKFSYIQQKPTNKKEDSTTDQSKRSFLIRSITGAAALTFVGRRVKAETVKSLKGLTAFDRTHHATPPGSLSIEHFKDTCTACSLCVTACPTNVIQPSFLENGWDGMMQPYMDFRSGLCNYDCVKCSEVCPNGAILPIQSIEEKHKVQIGVAKFIKENCIVETEGTDCGACSEHCPTKAVNMVPYGDVLLPKVTEEICVGCGACEHACPVDPYRAIYVDGNAVHQEAEQPKETEEQVAQPDDFPF